MKETNPCELCKQEDETTWRWCDSHCARLVKYHARKCEREFSREARGHFVLGAEDEWHH